MKTRITSEGIGVEEPHLHLHPQPPPPPPEVACVVALQKEKEEGGGGGEEEEEEEEEEKETLVIPEAQGPKPKLDDGFYEIETIRRKRVRKGQLQYLIKWRGWPETANTWEPLDNLQSVPDLIDAFEHSLKSGKHRKRKRKHVVHHILPKKRYQRSTTSYSLRSLPTSTNGNHPHSSSPLTDLPAHPQAIFFADDGEAYGTPSSLGKPKHANVNGFAITSEHAGERKEENDYDPKLSELKATTNTGVDANKLALHFQQAKISMDNGHMDGDSQSKVDCLEPVQSGRRRGAKRRKSGSVKRFKKEAYSSEPVDVLNAMPFSTSVSTLEPCRTGVAGYMGNNGHRNIVKIIRPMGYSASLSSNIQDVLVTFMAMRSDGTEVMVDNKYLKAYNPLLLINFYEQHLRYRPTS